MVLFNQFMKSILILLIFTTGLIACKPKPTKITEKLIYSSSAEFVKDDYLTDSIGFSKFKPNDIRSNDFAKTGQFSIKLDSINKYGFNTSIENVFENELIQASVWQKEGAGDGALIATIINHDTTTIRSYYGNTNVKENGWILHTLDFIVPVDYSTLNFYVFAGGKQTYFDDIKIIRHPKIPEIKNQYNLSIFIPDSSQIKLNSYSEQALKSRLIKKEHKKYVNAFIINNSDSIPINIRLKGDWTDHLEKGKTSYRIKIKGNNSFMGLKTFSIQHPSTRNYMNEWFMHQLILDEDLLTTKYEFITVKINGVNKGTYAIEEHFDKQLLEGKQRREGPILKFNEDGFWEVNPNYLYQYPFYEASHVDVFKKNRTLKNLTLKRQFYEGAKLLDLFKNNYTKIDQIFDLKNTAKLYALIEIGNGEHSLHWHNRRFYFNPITEKLEHIAFDLLAGNNSIKKTYVELHLNNNSVNPELINHSLLMNDDFESYYFYYLTKFTDTTYLLSKLANHQEKIKQYEQNIAIEHLNYKFDQNFYLNRAAQIKAAIHEIKKKWDEYQKNNINLIKQNEISYPQKINNPFIKEISLNAYVSKIDSAIYKVTFENYNLFKINIIGYKTKKDSTIRFKKPLILNRYTNLSELTSTSIITNLKPKKIIFKSENISDSICVKKVLKWAKPTGLTTRMKLEDSFSTNTNLFTIKDSILIFKTGSYTIDKLIYIPNKYKVIIPKNTTIDFTNGGGLIVNNSFYCEANDSSETITFKSSDRQNNGITILNAHEVKMNFVKTFHLNTLHYDNWYLTGGITIYESPNVSINNTLISGNNCEDALNIIRSYFDISNLTVSNTYSDGFDADFCKGVIRNSSFKNTGNDCIDFSGSEVLIKNINIINSGDKGISGGERSILTIENISIDGALTGIAAKDDTEIKGDKVKVSSAEFGLAAFQKKGEYDKAFIVLTNVTYTKLQKFGLLDKGSYVKINNQYFLGTNSLDIDKLYARFEKK